MEKRLIQLKPTGNGTQGEKTLPLLIESLTPREIEILALIEQGLSNKQIAQRLVISDKTVENHTTNIYQKLDVRNRMQAVRRASNLQLLAPNESPS